VSKVSLLALAVLSVAFLCCATAPATSTVNDYEVYVDFLGQLEWERMRLEEVELGTLVIEATTSTRGLQHQSDTPWKITVGHRTSLPGLRQSTIDSFEFRNQAPIHLDASRLNGHDVTLITDEELSKIFTRAAGGDGWWPDFYERYPNAQGVLTLSRTGVSSDGTQALIYYGNQWDGLAGIGEIVLLEKTENRWTIAKRARVWIS
jgi:hypothetical protein